MISGVIVPEFLITFWNSSTQLSVGLRWITFVWIGLSAIFAAMLYFVTDRIGTLQGIQLADQASLLSDQNHTIGEQANKINQQGNYIVKLNTDLSVLQLKADQLSRKAIDAERGVSVSYDFNGAYREKLGNGRTQAGAGPEMKVFQTIIELQNAKKWTELRELCEKQIESTPKWLTPYMFSGLAFANLGQLPMAVQRLQFVVEHAGSDPAYSEADKLLVQVKSASPQ
jgi:hypothetical protein